MQTDIIFDGVQDSLREVGAMLLTLRAKGTVNGTWDKTQLKTEADLIAEAMIIRRLRALTPDLPVVSEEDLCSHAVDRSTLYWLLDPIDGTASFCGGFDGFVTQIALMENYEPILGAVYAPALDVMYLAERNAGATANGSKLKLNWQGGGVILVDNYPEPRGIANLLFEQLPCAGYLESGSIGLKICQVADGKADIFVKDVTVRDWDLAPGHLILLEAGGVLTDLRSHRISYSGGLQQGGGLIAAASQDLAHRVTNFLAGVTKYGK